MQLPGGTDHAILIQLAKSPTQRSSIDLCVCQGVFLKIGGEVVPVRPSLPLQEQQNHRFNKPVQVSHGTGAGILFPWRRQRPRGN
jgi:hypothetical protein